jgi:transposase
MSRREAAEIFDVAISTAVKWLQRVRDTGSWAAKPRGGSTSRLEQHTEQILMTITEHDAANFRYGSGYGVARSVMSSTSRSLYSTHIR